MLGSPTTFTATTTSGVNVSYAWNFGDGSLGAGATLTHSYAATGIYTAIVTATNSGGSLTATTTVTVYSTAQPIANAGPDQTAHTGQVVTLNGSTSFDPGNFLPLTYHWQQTGGSTVTLTGANNVTATFVAPIITQTQALTFALTVTNTQSTISLPDWVVITVEPYRISLSIVIRQ
jgi:PKD repeat protein